MAWISTRRIALRSLGSFCLGVRFATAGVPGTEPGAYHGAMSLKLELLQRRMNDPQRFQAIGDREERSSISPQAIRAITAGKYLNFYRGCDMFKGPEDLSILYQMFWHVRPRTVIELGSYNGGSALWMADALNGANIECSVFSMDIDHSLLHPQIKSLQPPNLSFIQGDCNKLQEAFPPEFLSAQPHPFIVIDDTHINIEGTMDYFHKYLLPGDYLICEDTSPDLPSEVFSTSESKHWGYEKLHEWSRFLSKHGDMYAIDSFFSDLFGYNASGNWNGYARRMK